ncbi:ABC transporter ATP-binding protein [Flindersiella endophytica]
MTLLVRDLSVRYGSGRLALQGVSLAVEPGQVVAVVGESGSGKSTLLRALLGVLPRDAEVSGEVLTGRRLGVDVGYVGQDPYAAADPSWSVGHHVAEAWRAVRRRPGRGEIAGRLTSLGISHAVARLRNRPAAWSGGMLQRADLVAATAHDPPLVLADEPTSALDAELAESAMEALVGSSRSLLIVSHDVELVSRYADQVLVLRDSGRAGGCVDESPTRPGALLAPPVLPDDAPVIAALEQVTLAYRRSGRRGPVLRDVDLTVRAGEIVGLLGRSGSGKTTLLRAFTGQVAPVSGRIVLDPRPGFVMPVFQDSAASLDPRWPIWRTVAEAAAGNRRITPADREPAVEVLANLGLREVDPDTRPRELSGGQRQRVAVARALAGQARLVVADEPTAALDPSVGAEVARALVALAARGVALVVASHDERRLRELAHRVLRVEGDRLVPVA